MKSKPSPSGQPLLTVGVAYVRGILAGVRARGLPCAGLLRDAGIASEVLDDDAARVTVRQIASLLEVVIRALDDEALGLLAHPLRRGAFALQARATLGAPTLAVALRRLLHTFRLLHHGIELIEVRRDGLAGFALAFSDDAAARNEYLHEQVLRVYWRFLAWLVGGHLPALRFDFAYARPPQAEDYPQVFPAPWQFGAARSALWFEESRLAAPVVRDAAAFDAFLANGLINVLLPSRDQGMAGKVNVYLRQALPEWPDLERTAQALNMAVSTLQRHLSAEHTSFQALKDQLRREIAIHRLRTSNVPLAKLADELGFADAATFQRAFKSWTGQPPGSYRRQPQPLRAVAAASRAISGSRRT
ncbi:MAG: AraC family transcriptional regulator [Gammaproteobacteria bacterium]